MATTKRRNSTAARSTSGTKVVRTHRPVNTRQRAAALAVSAAFMQSMWVQPSWAAQPAEPTANLPTGGKWASNPDGTAGGTIKTPSATEMQMYQNQRAGVVDFNCFCSRQGTLINLTAPTTDSTTLIRSIEGANLWGRFTANDKVFITSSAGVYFSRTASVDVNSLLATSLSITNADFFAGRYNFSKDGSAGSVVNDGHINIVSVGGYAVLAGPQVQNNGVIVAHAGTVSLAAGDRVTLDMVGDGLIKVSVDASALNALALNSGSIEADGGRVVLTARSANALLDSVINNTGVIRAKSLVERGGEIVLDGGGAGIVANSGALDVSGADAGVKGGNVAVLGQYVALENGTRIDASGDAGGGTVLVGGNFQGHGPEQNAAKTFVASDATINADAISNGDGGKVIVWSDRSTKFYGDISAKGGASSGDGGFVEVSGKENLTFLGTVETTAANGKTGTLLLDPVSIDIITGTNGTGDQDAQLTSGSQINFGDPDLGGGTNTLTVARINAVGAGNNVLIEAGGVTFHNAAGATGNITIGNNNDFTISVDNTQVGAVGGTNNIVNTGGNTFSITTSGNGKITMIAGGSVTLTGVTLNSSGTGALAVTATAGSVTLGPATTGDSVTIAAGGVTGDITTGAGGTITSTGGNLALTAGRHVQLQGALSESGGALTIDFAQSAVGTFSTTAGITTSTISSGTAGSTFDFSAATGTVNATLAGSGATDTLKGRNVANTWTINAANGGNVVGSGTLTFTGIGTLVGGTNTDNFSITTGSVGGSIDGGTGSDTVSRTGGQTWNLTGADAGNDGTNTWTSIENLTDTGNGTFNMHSGADGSLGGNLTTGAGSTIDFSGYTTSVAFNLSGTANKTTGVTGTVSSANITTVVDSGNGNDTISGTARVYNLTGADQGSSGTISWTAFENLTDTGAGTFNMHSGANGSITGDLTAGSGSKIDYTGYTGGVTLDLAGTGTTGIGGTWSGVNMTVTGAAATSDTVTGASETYTLSGANAGNSGNTSWTSFENLVDTGAGTFNINNTASVTSIDGGTAGAISYAARTGPVTLNLAGGAGTFTGVTGTVSGITNVTGSLSAVDTVTGASKTYTLTAVNAGNSSGFTWSGFENITDSGTGTISAANQNTTLSAANKGTSTLLGAGFSGIGNLTDTGAGTFNINNGGSLSGNLDGGTAGTITYAARTGPVTLNLAGGAGAFTGVTGTVSGITNVTGSLSAVDTVTGASKTYTLTALNAGNSSGFTWTSFENIVDSGTGSISAAGQVTTLTGGNSGTTNKLGGTFSGIGNLTDTGTGTFNVNNGGSITGNLNGGTAGQLSYAARTGPVTLNLAGGAGTFTGVTGTVSGITNVTGSLSGADTVTGAGKAYTLTALNAGNSSGFTWTSFENIVDSGTGSISAAGQVTTLTGGNSGTTNKLGGAFSGIGNLTDTGTGTFNIDNGGSITGNLNGGTAGQLSYAARTGPVTLNLAGGAGTFTGVTGTVSGITNVAGSLSAADTVTGASKTYTLTGANAGNGGGFTWTSFENLTDTGTGTFNINNTATVTSINGGTAGTISYAARTGPVTLNLAGGAGTFTGVTGTVSNISTVAGSLSGADTVTGAGKTYTLTALDAGNGGGFTWTSFENIVDTGTGTIVATGQTTTLTGGNSGTTNKLGGAYSGIGNLTDTGNGTFNINTGGSITGNLNNIGGAGQISYAGQAVAVTLDLDGVAFTGVTGTVAGITNVVGGSTGGDSVIGTAKTYNLTGLNTGNGSGFTWSSFENIDDKTTGTISATGQTTTLTGANSGTTNKLGGTYSGIGNLTDTGTGTFSINTGGSITGNLNGGTNGQISYAGQAGPVTLNLDGVTFTGIGGTVSNITNVVGSASGADSVTGTGKTYTLTALNAGNSSGFTWSSFENIADATTGTIVATGQTTTLTGANSGTTNKLGGTYSNIGNLTDTGNGTFNINTGGSITGNLNNIGGAGQISYAGQAGPVTLDLDGANFTAIGGTVTGITNVAGSASGADSVIGTGKTYTLTALNAGNGGGFTWTSFENIADATTGTIVATGQTTALTGANSGTTNKLGGTYSGIGNLTDTGTGTFNINAGGSITGNLNGGTNGQISYAGQAGPVTLNLDGVTFTGIGGTVSNITNVVGSASGADSVTGTGKTYTLTALNAGNSSGFTWSSFENIADSTTGTISAAGQSTTLTGANSGTINKLGGTYSNIGNLTDTGTGTFNVSTGGSITGNLNGGTAGQLSYAGHAGPVTLNLNGGAFTGIGGTVTNISNVTGSANTADTVTGTSKTYTLSGLNAGSGSGFTWSGFENITDLGTGTISAANQNTTLTAANKGTSTLLGAGFSGIGNLTDTGTGTFNVNTGGSITGNLNGGTGGQLSYAGHAGPVTLNLAGGAGAFTGVTGTVSNISTVAGSSSGADTVTGASKTYTLTALDAGNSSGFTWTSFENIVDSGTGSISAAGQVTTLTGGNSGTINKLGGAFSGIGNLTDTGTGTFNINNGGSITGNLNGGAGGQLSYAARTGPVTLNLAGGVGAFTGVTGTVSNISTVAGSLSGADTVTGAGKTYTLTALNAGNSPGFTWTSFENIVDSGTGSISAAGQVTTLTGGNSGTTNKLGGTFSGIGNLTDTGTGTFNVNTGGSITGNLNGGTAGQLSYAGHVGPVTLNLNGAAFTGIAGTVTNISNVTGSANIADTVTGTGKTYTLTALNAGNGSGFTWSGFENIADTTTGTIIGTNQNTTLTGANSGTSSLLGGTYSKIGNLTDTGTGTFNVNTGGSITGNLNGGTNGQLSYAGQLGPVTLNLNGGGFTGIGGAVTNISTVVGTASGADSVTGTNKTYNLFGADAGSSGTLSWSSFENLVDSGAGTFNMNGGSITGNLSSGANGRLSYAGSPFAVQVFLDTSPGGFSGIGGTVTGINTLTGSSGSDVLFGNNRTWNLTGPNAGNTAGYTWTAFENVVDQGTTTTFNGSPGSGLDGVLGTGTATAITLNGTLSTGGQQLYAGAVTLGSATTIVGGAQIGFGSVTGTTFNFSATAASNITSGAIDTGTGTIRLIAGGALNVTSVRTTAITPAPGNPVGTFGAGSSVLSLFMDIQDQAGTGSPRQVLLTGSASSWTLTGPVGLPPDFAPTAASVGITFNGAVLAGIGLAAQAITGSIIGGVVADAARQAVLESQQTDSVQQQVAYGFAGDVGTTPPMDHRIDETGISVPRCFNDSREGQTCQ